MWCRGGIDASHETSERTHSPLNPSHISLDTEDCGVVGVFAVCQEITSSSIQAILQWRADESKATEEVE